MPRSGPAAGAAARCRRAPEDAATPTGGRIGPNAVLQLLPLIAAAGGPAAVTRVLQVAEIAAAPADHGMIDEAAAHRLHRALRRVDPAGAPALLAEAGRRTGGYVLAHRIPPVAQRALRLLPPALAAPLLARAIARHAWTFAGSGRFRAETPWRFVLDDNPLVRGEVAERPLCHWHAAVFETLYRALVAGDVRCVETSCGAQAGQGSCRFHLTRG